MQEYLGPIAGVFTLFVLICFLRRPDPFEKSAELCHEHCEVKPCKACKELDEIWDSASEPKAPTSRIIQLENMVVELRRAIHSGTTHTHNYIVPPLSYYGIELLDRAWKLVPRDDFKMACMEAVSKFKRGDKVQLDERYNYLPSEEAKLDTIYEVEQICHTQNGKEFIQLKGIYSSYPATTIRLVERPK